MSYETNKRAETCRIRSISLCQEYVSNLSGADVSLDLYFDLMAYVAKYSPTYAYTK